MTNWRERPGGNIEDCKILSVGTPNWQWTMINRGKEAVSSKAMLRIKRKFHFMKEATD